MKDSIKKLLTLMASVPNDKLLHFFYGSISDMGHNNGSYRFYGVRVNT